MAIPVAPKENAGGGSKMAFATYDNGGTNAAAIERAYQVATVNGNVLGDTGVYPTSGLPSTGYKATTGSSEIAIASSTPCQGVVVKADPDNTEDIWVGATGITTTKATTDGYRLSPGESIGIACRNLAQVFIRRGGSVNQAVYFSASKD